MINYDAILTKTNALVKKISGAKIKIRALKFKTDDKKKITKTRERINTIK